MTTLPTTSRTDAQALSTDLAQAGAVVNDATRLIDGGLWSKPADNNNQAAYLGMYTTDIHGVLADINAALANPAGGTVSGNTYTLSALVQHDLEHRERSATRLGAVQKFLRGLTLSTARSSSVGR